MTARRTTLLNNTHLAWPTAFVTGYSPNANDVEMARANAQDRMNFSIDPMIARATDSAAMVEYWDLTDAIVDGINALRLAGSTYLPKFTEEAEQDYRFRLKCTKLTNVYRDIVEALASKPFEEEISILEDDEKPPPSSISDFTEDVDGSGNNLTAFAAATFFNGINSAIDWIFVDFSKPDATIKTIADAKQAGVRPYWSHVLGRNILEVKSEVLNGQETLTYMRIYEPGTPDHVRVFVRNPDGSVIWSLYVKTNKIDPETRTAFVVEDSGSITIGEIPLVPFYTGRRDGRSWRFFPVMRDAADLQIELYQQESGLKFAKQLTAYPMLAGNGVRPPVDASGAVTKLAVGPGRVLYAPPRETGAVGSWAYIEPNASSLKFLSDDVKETIQQLRELGRQPLTAQSAQLTVITTAVAAGKAKSAVKAWSLNLKNALENALVLTCKWLSIADSEYDPVAQVYTEFDEFLDGKDLDALAAARYPTNGAKPDISQETYWCELKRRGVLSADFDADEETERLLKELPGDGEDMSDPTDPAPLIPPTDPPAIPPVVKPPVIVKPVPNPKP